ncbi:TetR family transcriptional regulator [Streptomyces cyaneogriseus subsp. noncyanogenus]|uniref:TetR family transcriptional regulator n=1 Tax=Streptomyces cyaneogriseus subsp. noncyanogenus TaxID=477245 RepID=A0A0C5GJN6_9ACTN|nr:TetR/AcrR family transcriptional regulator [Streptomyces cyaneogriseus]AJP04706.1 TetR family transcriptional regulator [Streptomyces cyaneogriseus subsp. noncyanogenus]
MPKGPTRRRPRTTARLLEAARETFAERGFHGSSIEAICERAGLTRGAFYSNFRTKDELFFALFDLHARRVIDRLTRAIDELDSSDDPVRAVLTRMGTVDETERGWYLLSTEFTLYAIRHPRTGRVLAEHDRRLREEIVRLLARLFDRLGRRPTVDLDALARLTTAVHEGSLAQSLVEPDRLAPEHLAVTFLPPLIDTLSEPAPREE